MMMMPATVPRVVLEATAHSGAPQVSSFAGARTLGNRVLQYLKCALYF